MVVKAVELNVAGNEFLTNPCEIGHVCQPQKYAEQKGDRIVYEKLRSVKNDPSYAAKNPIDIFRELMNEHYDAGSGE
ncbi:hypothetical protein COOONC_13168 [Cooperia oncophora]